jgi:myo-inositol 2-dehydrogenase / D-chiro-inositol 1-dehydrogenase
MAVFRLGLIGAGRMGQTHLRALAVSETVRITAATDPSFPIRDDLSARGLVMHETVDAMLDAGGLDGVLIAAPTDRHLELVRRVAAAGLPMLCEKPCGATAAEAREAARIAADASVRLRVGYWRRFVPALRRLRQRTHDGDLGELYFITCYQWDASPPPLSFRSHSGGIFIDMGVHEFDQIRWLTGQEFAAIHSVAATTATDPAVTGDSESAQALCVLTGGGNALVSLGRRFARGDACWTQVFGTKGDEECRFVWPPDGDATFHDALRRQAEHFATSIDGAADDGANADDAVAALAAADQASQALRGL